MTETMYDHILDLARQLSQKEQLELLEKLAASIRQQYGLKPKRSILDLQGLGKNTWKEINVQLYIKEERDSWNG